MPGIVNRTYERPIVQSNGGLDLDDGHMRFRFLNKSDSPIEFFPLSTIAGVNYDAGALSPQMFSSLSAMQTAISAATIGSGQFAYISCSPDLYHNPEFIMARVVQSRPAWRGIIPWSAVGFTPSVLASSGTGALSFDGSGRPVLSVGSTDGHFVEVLLGVSGGPPRKVRAEAQLQLDTVSGSGSGISSLTIRRSGDPTKYIQVFNQYFGGSWSGGWYYQSSGGFGSDGLDVAPSDASKYVTAKQVAFDMIFGTTGAQPAAQYEYVSAGDGSGKPAATVTVAGEGDFTVATQIWEMYARLRSTGAAGSLTITGLTYNTRA